MKKLILTCLLTLLPAITWAADPALKFNLDSAGIATITPDLAKGTHYLFKPYSASDGSLILELLWIEADWPKSAYYALPLKYSGDPSPIPVVIPPVIPPVVIPPVADKASTVIVVYEGQPKNQFWTGPTLATLCSGAGGAVYAYPVESVADKNTADIDLRWIGTAAGKELPWTFLTTKDGKVLKQGKYATEAAVIADLKPILAPATAPCPSCPSGACPLLKGGR